MEAMFMIFTASRENGQEVLTYTSHQYSLAGRNGLLYGLWKKRGEPRNQGWLVTSDDLLAESIDDATERRTRRLLVDVAPNAKRMIEVIEITRIYAFTIAADNVQGEVWWTPLMLDVRGVLHQDFDRDLSPEDRVSRVHRILNPHYHEDIKEFLYIHGDNKGWIWGQSGRTNAVYLEKQVRDYFRQYF